MTRLGPPQLAASLPGNKEYDEAECRRRRLCDERAELDNPVLALPIRQWCQLQRKLAIIGRIVEYQSERGGALLRRLANQVEEWARGEKTCGA